MPTYTVFSIEPPVSPSQLAAYKALRLTSLQIDPHAFISTYAREVAFSEDIWRQRLDSPSKQTLVASVRDTTSPYQRRNINEEADEWIGTATIVGPSEISPSVLDPLRAAGGSANWEVYGLYAMWIHPAHRGKGIGAQLVNACLEWARKNADAKFSSENSGDSEKVVVLGVYEDNVAGRALYFRAGFKDLLDGVLAEVQGQKWKWMFAKV